MALTQTAVFGIFPRRSNADAAMRALVEAGFDRGDVSTIVPELDAPEYASHLKEGGIVVSVHCDSEPAVRRAKDVLEHAGATHVAAAGEQPSRSDRKAQPKDFPD